MPNSATVGRLIGLLWITGYGIKSGVRAHVAPTVQETGGQNPRTPTGLLPLVTVLFCVHVCLWPGVYKREKLRAPLLLPNVVFLF